MDLWTKDKPTKGGWYWWCEFRDVLPIHVSETYNSASRDKWRAWVNGDSRSLEIMTGHFMGPIKLPDLPNTKPPSTAAIEDELIGGGG